MADASEEHPKDLEGLVPQRLRVSLSEAERRLLRAAPKGEYAVCGPTDNAKDPANDPAKADNWCPEREIRADLIRWLCTNEKASKLVDPRGVRVYAAKITGSLDLSFATVPFPLRLFLCRLTEDVDLRYVRIPSLILFGSSTRSLNMDGAEVRGGVFLYNGFSSAGGVRLLDAQIGGDLICGRGTFKNLKGPALDADRAEIKGGVFLNGGFSAVGEVRLLEARIGGSIECDGGRFSELSLNNASIKDSFSWSDMPNGRDTKLDLRGMTAGTIEDDEASWPEKGKLLLDGFVYGRINGHWTDARSRLRWLDRQEKFKPQPYRHLAKVLAEMGDDGGAKQVLFEFESKARAEDRRLLVHSPVRFLVRSTNDALSGAIVGYGIYPARAIWYLFGLTALGWIVHRRAQRVGAMVPTDKDAYAEFREHGRVPAHYPPFNPLIYSLENCVPPFKLGQDERWQPDPNPQERADSAALTAGWRGRLKNLLMVNLPEGSTSPVALRWLRWIMIGLGWLLATFFVAGLTGIIKTG